MLDITRMLTDRKFRDKVISYIDDPVVKNFWVTEFASWNDKFANEAVAPVLNKVGAFTANPMVRNIIGQPKSTFNLRQIMDNRKILIVNLSRGLVGEDNAAILGAMMVTKIQLAAMGRANMPEDKRRPFYLYVDEFQNFATDSFAAILSEARKYALNLTVANQYISQMSEAVRDAVFGNVGSIISFRVSPDDAPFLQKYFEPQFESTDLIQQHNRYFVITMMIDGEKAPAFSAKTLNLPQPPADASKEIIELSRQRYAQERSVVATRIRQTSGIDDSLDAANRKQNYTKQTQATNKTASKPGELFEIGKLASNVLSGNDNNSQSVAPSSSRRRRNRSHSKRTRQESKPPADKAGRSRTNANTSSDEYVIHLR
jgi:hypothetical protein